MKLELGSLKKQRKQLISLALLAGLLGLVYYYEFGQQTGTTTPASNAQVAATTPAASGPGPLPRAVDLKKLDPVLEESKSTRNPFRFGVPPPPPVVYHPPPPPPPPPPPAPVPTGPPPKPRIPLKFEGVVERKGYGKMAVLVYADGAGKEGVMQGREGDVIDGQYRIVKIGLNSITMEYLDGTGQQVIALSGT